jgi:hypothetical protein
MGTAPYTDTLIIIAMGGWYGSPRFSMVRINIEEVRHVE